MTLDYNSDEESSFSVETYSGDEIFPLTTLVGVGSMSECFPTNLEEDCFGIFTEGNPTWTISWIGTQGNFNDYLTSETILDYATYVSLDGTIWFGSGCDFSSLDDLNSKLSIYPNPTNGLLNIESEFNEETNITVLNNIGQVVLSLKTENNITLDLSSVKKGLYFIKSINECGKDKISKLIIE